MIDKSTKLSLGWSLVQNFSSPLKSCLPLFTPEPTSGGLLLICPEFRVTAYRGLVCLEHTTPYQRHNLSSGDLDFELMAPFL